MIKEQGFLSQAGENWAKVHRARNADWLSFAAELNRLAHLLHETVLKHDPGESPVTFTARVLLLRCHTSYQAGIILAERGLTADAQGSIRTAFEALFCLAACKDGTDIVERLIEADKNHKAKVARRLIAMPEDIGLDADGIAKMRAYLEANPGKYRDLNVADIAASTNLGEAYDVYFRDLSNAGSHISIGSLQRHTDSIGDDVTGLRYGPDMDDVTKTIAYACVVGLYLVKVGADQFKREDVDQALADIWPTYLELITETFPDKAQ